MSFALLHHKKDTETTFTECIVATERTPLKQMAITATENTDRNRMHHQTEVDGNSQQRLC